MKISKKQLRSIIKTELNEAEFDSSSDIEGVVTTILKNDGGAASLDDIQAGLDGVDKPESFDMRTFLQGMVDRGVISQLEDGDYATGVDEVRNVGSAELRLIIKEASKGLLQEDGHTNVPSAKRSMMTCMEDATDIMNILVSHNNGHQLPSWWMKKVTLAADYLNTARDYLVSGDNDSHEQQAVEHDICPACGSQDGSHAPGCPYNS